MGSPSPLPLHYATPASRGRFLAWRYHIRLGVVVLVSLVMLLSSLEIVPHLAAGSPVTDRPRPAITNQVVGLCWWLGWGWYGFVIMGAAGAAIAVGVVIDALTLQTRHIRRYVISLSALLMLADVLWLAVVVWAILAPAL